MAYGIDDTIQQKVDAYRGNPAALQQRYAQNQELIDLLALQKLKSEKEAAARDLQMKMQNTPNTIAKQREQEVLGLTKNEMVKQTSDIMKQRQAQQMAQRGAAPAPQGIASQAAPRMMAAGGIVALAPGGPVSSQEKLEQIQAIRAKIASGEISAAEGEAQIEAIAPTGTPDFSRDPKGALRKDSGLVGKAMNALGIPTSEVADLEAAQRQERGAKFNYDAAMRDMPYREAMAAAGAPTAGGRVLQDGKPMRGIDPSIGNFGPVGQGAQLGATTNVSPPMQGPPVGPKTEAQPPAGAQGEPPKPYTAPQLDKGLGQVAAPTTRTKFLDREGYGVKMSDAASSADARKGIKSLMDTNAAAMQKDAMKYGLESLGMSPERIAAEKARQQALADLDRRQLAGNQREQLSAFLRGTAQAGSMAGGSAAAANVRAQQQLGERNRLLGRQEGERAFEKLGQDIKVKAYDSATKAFEIANQNIRQGVSSMTQFNATEVGLLSDNAKSMLQADEANMRAEDADAKRILDAQIANASNETKVAVANLEASISDRRTTLQNQLERAKEGRLERKDVDQLLNQVAKYAADVRAKYQKVYQDAISALPFGEDNKKREAELKEEMNSAIVIALADLAERTKELEKRRASLPTADGFGDLQ